MTVSEFISEGMKRAQASGRHLQSDTYTTLAIIAGLILIYFTGLRQLDSIVAIIMSVVIMVIGYRIARRSVAGIMDEADEKILGKVISLLNNNRLPNWIDIHNLRMIKFGNVLHVDCHMTVPWYLNVNEAHEEIVALSALAKKGFGESIEMFAHSDACMPFQCSICNKQNCPVRQHDFSKASNWTPENIRKDKKHRYEDLNKVEA